MASRAWLLIAADAVLLLHFLVVVFIVGGLVLIYTGRWRAWHWVGNRWFRLVHLGAMAVVVLQSWFGMICPLTTLEMMLRERAGDAVYAGSFVGHWLQTLLYYEAPPWVFALVYTVFGVLVALSWVIVPPRAFGD